MTRTTAVALAATLLLCGQTPVTPSPQVPSVIAELADQNAALQHYTFTVDARIALLTFPWIRFRLHGHGTYTRGGDYSVHFDNVPWFGHAFATMPMGALDPTTWPSLYTMTIFDEQGGTTTLSMHDIKRSRLIEARATIDPIQGLREILWTYDYGGHVRLKVVPQIVTGHYLPADEEAEIVMPRYRAMAWATFSDYHVEMRTPVGPYEPGPK